VCGVLVCPWMPRVPQPQSSVPKCSRYGEAEAQGEGAEAGRFELRKVAGAARRLPAEIAPCCRGLVDRVETLGSWVHGSDE
jgi:hypothetical protein